MNTFPSTHVRDNLFSLIDEVTRTCEPVLVTDKRGNVVLISEADWRAIKETLFLSSIPRMSESISEGLSTPIEECSDSLDWN